jgi:hypothetical protein
MLEGKCPKCGLARYGWALLNPRYQTCATCGVGLEITENGHKVMTGFSPFEAERIDISNPEQSRPASQKNEESS